MPAITSEKIEYAIFQPVLDKTSGINGIGNRIFREISFFILPNLLKLLNIYLDLAYY